MVKAAIDKWKTKKWFEIIAPALFKEKKIGETFAEDYRMLLGRGLEVSLADLAGDSKLQRIKLIFKIRDVKGERALTDYLGHKITQDYERSLARRRSSKIYSNQTAETKDGRKVVVKIIVVPFGKINQSVRNSLRKKLNEAVAAAAKGETFDAFTDSILYGKLSANVKKALHKVYPVRHAVIQKSEAVQAQAAAQ